MPTTPPVLTNAGLAGELAPLGVRVNGARDSDNGGALTTSPTLGEGMP
jgi:hypothetical protein